MDAVVESECRDLLAQAGRLIFTNLCLLCNSGVLNQAGLRLGAVLEPVQADGEEVVDDEEEPTEPLLDEDEEDPEERAFTA